MDRDSKLIFEKYTSSLFIEQYQYNPDQSGATIDIDENPSEFSNFLRTVASDPLYYLNKTNNWAAWLRNPVYQAKFYYNLLKNYSKGTESNRELRIIQTNNDSAYDKISEATLQIYNNVVEGKRQNLQSNDTNLNQIFDKNIKIILDNFKLIQESANLVNKAMSLRTDIARSGYSQAEPITIKQPNEYYLSYTQLLQSKEMSGNTVTNIEEVQSSLINFINQNLNNQNAENQPQPSVSNKSLIFLSVEQFKQSNQYKQDPVKGEQIINMAKQNSNKEVAIGNYRIQFTDL